MNTGVTRFAACTAGYSGLHKAEEALKDKASDMLDRDKEKEEAGQGTRTS